MLRLAILCVFWLLAADEWVFEQSADWEFVVTVTPSTDTASSPPAKEQQFYVVMYGATWCKPCATWKKTQMPALQAAGVRVVTVDCDRDTQWTRQRVVTHPDTGEKRVFAAITLYPTIEIVRERDKWPVARLQNVPAKTVMDRIAAITKQQDAK
mgnify:CR=1 FL=1